MVIGDRKTVTHRNPKVGIGLPQINPDLLADRMRCIDDAPRALLSADPDHLLPGHAHTRIGRYSIQYDDYFPLWPRPRLCEVDSGLRTRGRLFDYPKVLPELS